MYHKTENYRKLVNEIIWLEELLMTEEHRKDTSLILRHDVLCQQVHAHERGDADDAMLAALCDRLEGERR